MTSPLGTDLFFREIWRRRPELYRGLTNVRAGLPDVLAWSKKPARARLFTLKPNGTGQAAQVEVDEVSALIELLEEKRERYTVLLNAVENTSSIACDLRTELGIGRRWRHGEIVATWSTPEAGIGYHAGHEDGFIIQLAGFRRWKIWTPDVLPKLSQLALVRDDLPEEPAAPTAAAPYLDIVLRPGDGLYLPPFAPHQGVTIGDEGSVSLSIAWRGVTVRRLLAALGVTPRMELPMLDDLLPDPDPSDPSAIAILVSALRPALGDASSLPGVLHALEASVGAVLATP